jgi:hypothetical protein
MRKFSKVKWSGFQTSFEIRTKKSGFGTVGPFYNKEFVSLH